MSVITSSQLHVILVISSMHCIDPLDSHGSLEQPDCLDFHFPLLFFGCAGQSAFSNLLDFYIIGDFDSDLFDTIPVPIFLTELWKPLLTLMTFSNWWSLRLGCRRPGVREKDR